MVNVGRIRTIDATITSIILQVHRPPWKFYGQDLARSGVQFVLDNGNADDVVESNPPRDWSIVHAAFVASGPTA